MSRQWNGPTLLRGVAVPVLLGFLASCSEVDEPVIVEPPPTFAELVNESLTLADELEDLEDVAVEDLPTSGRAEYEGVMVVDAGGDTTLAGEMDLAIDFADEVDPISGQVSNIVDSANGRYDGTLDLSDSFLDADANPELGPVAGADLTGTLTDPEDQEYEVDAVLGIGFAGEEPGEVSHVGGLVGGTACGGGDCSVLDGAFVVSR